MEFIRAINVEHVFYLPGLIILAYWLLKTSLGTRALADSVPRRNDMPLYMPFVPLLICFGIVPLAILFAGKLLGDLEPWQSDFMDNIIFCIGELTAIAVIIHLARIHFVRRLKGFGLNVKTIYKDFVAAFMNLWAIWPLIMVAMILTAFFGELIWGTDYQIQQHQQLELISQYPQLSLRIIVVVLAVVVAPLLEEMIFRGLFQTTIRSYLEAHKGSSICNQESSVEHQTSVKAWLAIVISSGLFVMMHADVGHWPALFVLGVCMGYAYEKSGSLFRPIFIHLFFNATSIMAALYQ